jgi:hypothetical protein
MANQWLDKIIHFGEKAGLTIIFRALPDGYILIPGAAKTLANTRFPPVFLFEKYLSLPQKTYCVFRESSIFYVPVKK